MEGPPTLVVEILSPSTRDRDQTLKARRYAALGIPHYWIVDPDAVRIAFYRAEGQRYVMAAEAEGAGGRTRLVDVAGKHNIFVDIQ